MRIGLVGLSLLYLLVHSKIKSEADFPCKSAYAFNSKKLLSGSIGTPA
jgi:hypothetical protein